MNDDLDAINAIYVILYVNITADTIFQGITHHTYPTRNYIKTLITT